MSETNELTQFILDFFFQHGIFAKRHGVASGKSSYMNKNQELKSRFIHAGITGGHDIFAWLPNGPFLGVEIKTGKDRLSPEQIGFHANIVKMGHLSMVVHSKDDFLEKFYAIPKKN